MIRRQQPTALTLPERSISSGRLHNNNIKTLLLGGASESGESHSPTASSVGSEAQQSESPAGEVRPSIPAGLFVNGPLHLGPLSRPSEELIQLAYEFVEGMVL